MIQFQCEHCRQPVRVDDKHGGKRGRCPHCDEVVLIPPKGTAIEALAAALRAPATKSDEDTSVGIVPPPPPVENPRPLEEDFLLPGAGNEALADTVILPAEALPPPPEPRRSIAERLFHPPPEAREPPINPRRTLLVVAIVLVVLAAAAIGFYVLTQMR
jgi:DNA-directed RNA polymerase subunit RPC12/RpoP